MALTHYGALGIKFAPSISLFRAPAATGVSYCFISPQKPFIQLPISGTVDVIYAIVSLSAMAGFFTEQTNAVRFAMKYLVNHKSDVRRTTQGVPGESQS